MIDMASETLIAFRDVPKRLPRRPNGKAIHFSVVYRWAQKGLKSGIVLESLKIGGTTYTSLEALQRFADAITGKRSESPSPLSRMTRTRQAQAQQAERQVRERLGLSKPSADPAAESFTPSNIPTDSQAHHAPLVRGTAMRNTNTTKQLTGLPQVYPSADIAADQQRNPLFTE